MRTKAATWNAVAEEWGTIKDYSILNSTYQAAMDIRNDIEDLIEWSLDYTQSPYIDGLSTPIFWTENSIKQYLGFDSLIKIDKLYPLSAEWAYQCYKILNALKIFSPVYYMSYFSETGTQITRKESVYCGPYRYLRKQGGGATWSEALSNFSSDTEVEVSGDLYTNTLKYSFVRAPSGIPDQYGVARFKPRYNAFLFGEGPVTVRLESEYSLYMSFLTPDPMSSFTFNSHNDLNVENSLLKYQMSETLLSNSDFIFSNYMPMADSFNSPPLPSSSLYNWIGYGQTGTSSSGERRTYVITCEPTFSFIDA